MTIQKATLAFTIYVLGLVFAVAPAIAVSTSNVIATVELNVRSGPGTNYNVIDTLYPGEVVHVNQCQQSWCFINHSGPDGWVASQYLRPTNQPYLIPDDGPSPQVAPSPPSQPGFPVDPWPGPTIQWPFQPWPGNPSPNPAPNPGPISSEPEFQVCFYSQNNYSGASTCVLSGRSFGQLGPRWNDKISSFQVFPGASVTLCQSANFQGVCRSYRQNIPVMSQQLNNNVSSLRVD